MTTPTEMIRAQERALNFFFQDKSGRETGISRHLCGPERLRHLLECEQKVFELTDNFIPLRLPKEKK